MQFPADQVLQHAGIVAETAEELVRARAVAGEVVMDSEAYGRLCQFLPALFAPLVDLAVEVMTEAADAFGETELTLRETAADMTVTDGVSAARWGATGWPP